MSKILTIQNHLFQKVESENIQITEKRFKPQYVFALVQLDAMPLIKMSHLLRSHLYTMPKISQNVLDYISYGENNKMTLKRNIVSLQIKQKPLSGSCH